MNLWTGGLLSSKLVFWGPTWVPLLVTARKSEDLFCGQHQAFLMKPTGCSLREHTVLFLGPPGYCSEMQVLLAIIMGWQGNCQTL